MLNPQRNAISNKRKFETSITTLTLLFCVIGLTGMSIISFFQTQSAFLPLNDPTMVFSGIQFGSWISLLAALIFQYGQNAALYVKNTYATGKVFIVLFGKWKIKDTTLCWIVFWLCAGIDAGTNCLWLYNQEDIRKQHVVFQGIEYAAMIMIVGVEEVLGITLQAFFHSFTILKQIIIAERIPEKKPTSQTSLNTTQKLPKSNREEYQKKSQQNNSSQSQKPKDRQEPNYSQRPSTNNPKNDFFKTVQNNKSDNPQTGRYLEMMKQKEKGGSSSFPYEHSDDPPDWNN